MQKESDDRQQAAALLWISAKDVFLGKLEIKNTFYNIPVASSMTEARREPEWPALPRNDTERSSSGSLPIAP